MNTWTTWTIVLIAALLAGCGPSTLQSRACDLYAEAGGWSLAGAERVEQERQTAKREWQNAASRLDEWTRQTPEFKRMNEAALKRFNEVNDSAWARLQTVFDESKKRALAADDENEKRLLAVGQLRDAEASRRWVARLAETRSRSDAVVDVENKARVAARAAYDAEIDRAQADFDKAQIPVKAYVEERDKRKRALELATEAVRSAEQEVADVPIKNALVRKAVAARLTLSLKEVDAALVACRFAT